MEAYKTHLGQIRASERKLDEIIAVSGVFGLRGLFDAGLRLGTTFRWELGALGFEPYWQEDVEVCSMLLVFVPSEQG